MIDKALMTAELTRDEAVRLRVYDDANGAFIGPGTHVVGHPTIGIGRALDTHGITALEAGYLNGNDIDTCQAELSAHLAWFEALDDVRQRVLLNMAFNLGIAGLLQFHDTLRLIQSGQYEQASVAMEESHWATEVGARASRLAQMMRTGEVV